MIDSFNDFVGGDERFERKPSKSIDIKPYIYVLRYIISKDDYFTELKEYIINYSDEQSDFEDDNAYDSFIDKLKELAENNEFTEIEDMIDSYEDFSEDNLDYDEDDEDYEEKLYGGDYLDDDDEEEYLDDSEDLEFEVQNSQILSDKLKDFLKLDLQFEDLDEEYSYDEPGVDNIVDIKYEEIKEEIEESINEFEESINENEDMNIEDDYDEDYPKDYDEWVEDDSVETFNEYMEQISEEAEKEYSKTEDPISMETAAKTIGLDLVEVKPNPNIKIVVGESYDFVTEEEYEKRKKKTPKVKTEQKDKSAEE